MNKIHYVVEMRFLLKCIYMVLSCTPRMNDCMKSYECENRGAKNNLSYDVEM